ncbi:MAG: ankyrin repeat domain-containing protein, partial [Gemmataceae bacterium]
MGKRKARQQVNPHVEQRGGLATQVRLDPDPTLFKRLGGRRVVARIVAAFYERIAADARLRPKFGGDLTQERANQQRFFEEWLGGTPLYSQHVAKRGLRQIHEHIHINKQDAATWLRHFAAALAAAKVAAPLRREVLATLTPLARALVNEQGEAAPHEQRCRRTQRWAAVNKAAATGNVKVVQQAIVAEPRLLKGWADHMQTLLYLAAGKGRANVVQLLLEAGADPNSPSHVWWACGLETPLLAARRRRRTAIVKLLHEYG